VLSPIATEMKRLVADRGEMDNILRKNADRARAIAQPIMDDVRKIVGFVR
jgi:tryptophanyl-tRNA synthetase